MIVMHAEKCILPTRLSCGERAERGETKAWNGSNAKMENGKHQHQAGI